MNAELTTERLIMRPLTQAHFETFYQTFILDPKTMRFWHAYRAELIDEARRKLARRDFFDPFEESQRHGYPTWFISQKRDPHKLVGWCGLWLPVFKEFGPELTYMLASPYFGRGFAPEAVSRLIQESFEYLDIDGVQAVIDAPNRASRRVVEKLGFRFRGKVAAYGSGDMVQYTLKRAHATALLAKDPHHAPS